MLIREFQNLSSNATEVEVDQYVRAYLLAWCGNCAFPNSTDTYVNAIYLQFIENLDLVTSYAWGTAVLVYLRKSLTEFVMTPEATDLRGFTPILQVWSYEHFPWIGRPIVAPGAPIDLLLARYITGHKTYCHDPHHALPLYRQEFDLVIADRVVWTPYPDLSVNYGNMYGHRSCLIHLKTICNYSVERCMWQFYFIQDVPGVPRVWSRNITGKATRVELQIALDAWYRRIEDEFRLQGTMIDNNSRGCTNNYITWYGNPKLYNDGTRYEEPRYVPRGYGDEATNLLWERCTDSAGQLHALCNQFGNLMGPAANFVQQVQQVADTLRDPLPGGLWPLPRKEVFAPIRQHHVPPASPELGDPYMPIFMEEQGGDGVDVDDRVDEDDYEMHTPFSHTYEYGASSSTQRPKTLTYSHPHFVPIEPTQDAQPPRRSTRVGYRIPTNILACPYCSNLRGNRRCPNHQ